MEYNIIGKYNKDCKIFAKTVEEDALKTIYSICDCPAFKNQKIRVMCDVHSGQGIVIGFSSTIDKENPMVNPSHVGVDIGCQVTCIKMSKPCPEESYALLEHRWKKDIPTGFTIYDKKIADEKMFYKMCNTAIDRAVATTNFVKPVTTTFNSATLPSFSCPCEYVRSFNFLVSSSSNTSVHVSNVFSVTLPNMLHHISFVHS